MVRNPPLRGSSRSSKYYPRASHLRSSAAQVRQLLLYGISTREVGPEVNHLDENFTEGAFRY